MRRSVAVSLAVLAGLLAAAGLALCIASCSNLGDDGSGGGDEAEVLSSTEADGADADNGVDASVQGIVALLSADDPGPVDQGVADAFPVTVDLGGATRELVAAVANEDGMRVTWEVPLGITDVATSLLTEWGQCGNMGLCFSGYLDLAEHVWGCVMWSEQGFALLALADERFALDQSLGIFDEEEPTLCRLTLAIPEVSGA